MLVANYPMFFIAFTIFIICIIIGLAIKNGSLRSCKNYIINVYLYIALSYLALRLFVYLYEALVIPEELLYSFMAFSITMVCLVFLSIFKSSLIIYPIYLILLAAVAFLLRPIFQYKQYADTINDGILQTVLLLIIIAVLSINFEKFIDKYSHSILTGLFIGLFSIIIIEGYNIIINNKNISESLTVDKILTYISVIIFAIFIAYDSHRIRKDALRCGKALVIANYPRASLNIYVDFINLFIGS